MIVHQQCGEDGNKRRLGEIAGVQMFNRTRGGNCEDKPNYLQNVEGGRDP